MSSLRTKNEKALRAVARREDNKHCVDCTGSGGLMPQYVCITLNTFVCTNCSTVHREMSHRVKGISMSNFSDEEVRALKEKGNQHALNTWYAKWDPKRDPKPESGDIERTKRFLRMVYKDKAFFSEEPVQEGNEQPQTSAPRSAPQVASEGGRSVASTAQNAARQQQPPQQAQQSAQRTELDFLAELAGDTSGAQDQANNQGGGEWADFGFGAQQGSTEQGSDPFTATEQDAPQQKDDPFAASSHVHSQQAFSHVMGGVETLDNQQQQPSAGMNQQQQQKKLSSGVESIGQLPADLFTTQVSSNGMPGMPTTQHSQQQQAQGPPPGQGYFGAPNGVPPFQQGGMPNQYAGSNPFDQSAAGWGRGAQPPGPMPWGGMGQMPQQQQQPPHMVQQQIPQQQSPHMQQNYPWGNQPPPPQYGQPQAPYQNPSGWQQQPQQMPPWQWQQPQWHQQPMAPPQQQFGTIQGGAQQNQPTGNYFYQQPGAQPGPQESHTPSFGQVGAGGGGEDPFADLGLGISGGTQRAPQGSSQASRPPQERQQGGANPFL